jgi:membrane-associated phospholipid phosphatase
MVKTILGRIRDDWMLLLLAVLCLGIAWMFAKVGSEVLEGELLTLDRAVRGWFQSHRTPVGMAIFSIITHFGAKELLAPLGVIIGWRLFRDTRRLLAVLAFSALACGEFIAMLKRNFHIGRPIGGVQEGLGYSFPSGHSAGSMAIAIVLSYVAVRRNIHPRIVTTTAAIGTSLVGISRIYLDLHWTSDVLGGWLVGSAFGAGCCALYEWVSRKEMKKGRVDGRALSSPSR